MSQPNPTAVHASSLPAAAGNKGPLYRIASNLLLWLCFAFVALALHQFQASTLNERFPAKEILRFLDWKFVGFVTVACFMLFGLFALVGAKAKSVLTQQNAEYFSQLALEEWGSQTVNIGSLMAACSLLTGRPEYLIGTAVAYVVGYVLMR